MLPPALLDEDQCPEGKDGACVFQSSTYDDSVRIGMPLKRDPFGRDVPRRSEEWSVEPLSKYLKGVATQIEANLQRHGLPTDQKLDAFTSKLVAHVNREIKHAPKSLRHTLQGLFSRRFQKFWNFIRNEKVRTTNPEELKSVLGCLVEALISEFGVNPESLAVPPRPGRPVPSLRRLP